LAETAGAASFGRSLGERAALRFVLRGDTSTGGTPGATDFYRADLDARYERSDLLALAQVRVVSDRVVHEWRLGVGSTDQLSVNPEDSGPYTPVWAGHTGYPGSDLPNPEGFQNNTRRATASYLVEAQLAPRQLLTAGFDLERESGAIGDRRAALLSPERTNVGAYVQDRIVIGERAFLTLGGRLERNDSYGWAAVPRAALALRVRSGPDATTLRASAGAGIKEPSFLESFGVSLFTRGNPRLDPERSRTFDLGLDQRLVGGHVRAEATVFDHTYLKEIAYFIESYDPFVGTYKNLGKTRARGVEVAFEAAPISALRLSAEYTYLDGKILVSTTDFDPVYAVGRSLLRRPKHQASLMAEGEAGRFSASATMSLVGRRADSDFLGMGLEENAGYARLDARVRTRVGRGLEVFLATENLLDRKYMEVLGYPALGRSVRVGLRLRSVRAERS
jgi:outer membrane cobalamin receptor